MKLEYFERFSSNLQISNLMQIRPVGVELFHAVGQTDRQTQDETISRFSQLCEKHLITNNLMQHFPLFLRWTKTHVEILMLNLMLHMIITRFQKVKPMPKTARPRKQVSTFLQYIISLQLSTNTCTYIKFHNKTLKIAPTCFDPKIILRELRCSLLKSF